MEMRFAYPWMLFMLWLAPIMLTGAVLFLKRKEARLAQFVAPVMQKRLRPATDFSRQLWQIALAAAGILFCMIAAARPQWGRSEQTVFRKGRDVVICLDVSRSMLANDVHPNRLRRAKIDIMDLINDLSGDRTALLAFRHKAVTLCPLTTDYAFLRHILDMSGIHSAPRGETDIGSAIDHAVEILSGDDSSHKAILLISDGEDLTGKAMEAAEKSAKRGIPIFTVGFGRASGSTIPDEETGGSLKYKGSDVVSKLDNDTLYRIAKTSGGAYIPIQTASTAETTLGNIYKDHFSKIAARELEETLTFSYSERFHYFLIPGILLLLAACFLSKGRLTGRSRTSAAISDLKNIGAESPGLKQIAIALILIAPALCLGATNPPADTAAASAKDTRPEGRAAARKAQRLHDAGNFSEAANLYLHAARTMTGPARESFIYNSAVSLFNEGKFSEAIDLLNTISGEGSIPLDKLNMALGSAHYRTSDTQTGTNEVTRLEHTASNIEKAAEYFAEAARLNAGQRNEALNNAGLLLQKLPEAERAAKEAALLAENEQTAPFDLLDKMLKNQRDITRQAAEAYTTDDPSQIKLLESLAEQQEQNADLWIPMKEKLAAAASASTNQMSVVQLEQLAGDMASTMRESAAGMKDLDTSGYHQSALAGESTYRLWKQMAPFSKVLEENLMRQSNAMDNAAAKALRSREQKESADLTSIFKDRFTEAFPENAPAPPAEEESDQMTPEKRKRILELADNALKSQRQAAQAIDSDDQAAQLQEDAFSALNEISQLLPREQNKDDKHQQDQNKQQEDQEQKPEDNEEKADDQQSDPQPQKSDDKKQEDETDKQEQETEQPKEQELSDADVERLLEKALQREKEHEEDIKRRNEFTPSKMIDRDW